MVKERHPRKKYREPPPPIATFRQLLRGTEKWFWVTCNNHQCLHSVAVPLAPLAIRWGLDAEATTIVRQTFRCSRCGDMTSTLTAPSVVVGTGGFQAFPPERGLRVLPAHAWLDAMCNLYSLNSTREGVGRLFSVSHNRMIAFDRQLTLFPGRDAPVVRLASDGERELVSLPWGFMLLMTGKAPRRVTNARDDKIHGSGFWKSSYEERRCLVPVTSFSEPKGEKPATWYWFALNGEEPRPLFAFAGIWRKYKGPIKKDGETVEQDVFAFLTTKPNKLIATINHERMPVILTKEEDFNTWLNGKTSDADKLVRQYPSDQMRIVQEGLEKADKQEV